MILKDFNKLQAIFDFLGFKNLQDIKNFKDDIEYNKKQDFKTNLINYYNTLKSVNFRG